MLMSDDNDQKVLRRPEVPERMRHVENIGKTKLRVQVLPDVYAILN